MMSTLAVAPGAIGPAIAVFKVAIWPAAVQLASAKVIPDGNESLNATAVAIPLPWFVTVNVKVITSPAFTAPVVFKVFNNAKSNV